MMHRYELEKYDGIKSRYECPECGQPHAFSRYIDTETGQYLSPEVGRCNREDKCAYHYTPREYFIDHHELDFLEPDKLPAPEYAHHVRTQPKTGEIGLIPSEYVARSLGKGSDFVCFLNSIFDPDTVARLRREYKIGGTDAKAVIYWQNDTKGRTRAGKVMRYNPDTGKRIKSDTGAIGWVHSSLKKSGVLSDAWELHQCLFGEHLLPLRPSDTVCLVEGEKSAIIGSGVMPEYIWLATGGKQNLKADMCECLRGRKVILFPDLNAFDAWSDKGRHIAQRVGFALSVFGTLEQVATPEERYNGLDIADYLIQQLSINSLL